MNDDDRMCVCGHPLKNHKWWNTRKGNGCYVLGECYSREEPCDCKEFEERLRL